MQTSVLRKLLQLIKNETPEEEKSSVATLELDPSESDSENPTNSELEIQKDESDDEMVLDEPVIEARPVPTENNRAHLTSSVPRAAKIPNGTLTKGELAQIRSLFKNMDDNEIQRLYKKVTK